MRWGDRPALSHGSASRDEDALLHEPHAPPPVLKRAGHAHARTGAAFGRSVRPGKPTNKSKSSSTHPGDDAVTLTPRSSDLQQPPPLLVPSTSFLVCAGKSVGSNNDEHADDSNSTNDSSNGSESTRRVTSIASLQRTDADLERIISELRETIVMQQQQQREAIASATLDARQSSSSDSSDAAERHARRHLKNPVERMMTAADGGENQATALASMLTASSSGLLMRRQQSASHITRPQTAGRALQLSPPEVVATGIASTAALATVLSSSTSSVLPRASLAASSGHISSAALVADSRVYDNNDGNTEGMRIRSYMLESVGSTSQIHSLTTSVGIQRPVVSSTVDAIRRPRVVRKAPVPSRPATLELELLPSRGNNASDSDDASPLNADVNPFFTRRSALSPVGPWLADENDSSSFEPQSAASCSSRSPQSISAARAPFDDVADFAERSPRSRLLWFSAWADSASSLSVEAHCIARSANHAGASRPSSASATLQRASMCASVMRCTSAAASRGPSHRRGTSATPTEAPKRRTAVLSRKRPQSSAARVRTSAVS